MATATALLIDPALRKVGASTPQDAERTNALSALNAMLNSWSAQRLLVFSVTRESFPLVVNTGSYTIGTGGAFSTARPNRIVDAYIRDSSSDFRLTIRNLKNFNDILVKTDNGRPTKLYYLNEYPLGKILFDQEPDKIYTVFLDSWKPLSTITTINTEVSLPPEYEEALIYNLAVRLAPEHDASLPKEVVAIAVDSLRTIKRFNAQHAEEVEFRDLPISLRNRNFDIESGGIV